MIGQYMRHGIEQRVKELERIKIMLEILCAQLEYSQAPISSLLDSLCSRSELKKLSFLDDCRTMCLSGETFPVAWHTGLKRRGGLNNLKVDDISLLLSLGDFLGTTDTTGQIKNLRLHQALLSTKLDKARHDSEKYGKACSSIGILAGIAVGAVLI
ncbi:MAG TPA: stage III sporulation protein AB [Clostridia bacterium]|nr:stage III sporulation protein AB [Clostridia bacterium]